MTTADALAALAADQLAVARAAVRAQVAHCRGPEPEIVRIVLKAVLARKWDRYRSLQRATRLA